MHCNLRPPSQSFPALITTQCQVWSRWTYPLPYYSVSAADTLLYAVTLTFDLLLLTLNICSISPVTWWNSVRNLNAVEQSAAELLWFQYLTLWPCVTCCARLWHNFHQVWTSTSYPCLNYSVFDADTLCHAVIVIFDLLTLKLLQHFGCHAFKLCTKFERKQIIHRWVIDHLARFRRAILGVGHDWQTVLRGAFKLNTEFHHVTGDTLQMFKVEVTRSNLKLTA